MVTLEEFRKFSPDKKLDALSEQIVELAKNISVLMESLKVWTENWTVLNKELNVEFEKKTLSIQKEIEKAVSKADEKRLIKLILAGNNNKVLDYIKRKWAAYVV